MNATFRDGIADTFHPCPLVSPQSCPYGFVVSNVTFADFGLPSGSCPSVSMSGVLVGGDPKHTHSPRARVVGRAPRLPPPYLHHRPRARQLCADFGCDGTLTAAGMAVAASCVGAPSCGIIVNSTYFNTPPAVQYCTNPSGFYAYGLVSVSAARRLEGRS